MIDRLSIHQQQRLMQVRYEFQNAMRLDPGADPSMVFNQAVESIYGPSVWQSMQQLNQNAFKPQEPVNQVPAWGIQDTKIAPPQALKTQEPLKTPEAKPYRAPTGPRPKPLPANVKPKAPYIRNSMGTITGQYVRGVGKYKDEWVNPRGPGARRKLGGGGSEGGGK